jgi:hypothetical protein
MSGGRFASNVSAVETMRFAVIILAGYAAHVKRDEMLWLSAVSKQKASCMQISSDCSDGPEQHALVQRNRVAMQIGTGNR